MPIKTEPRDSRSVSSGPSEIPAFGPLLVSDLPSRAISNGHARALPSSYDMMQPSDSESEDEPDSFLDLGGGFHVPLGLPRSQQHHTTLKDLMRLLDNPNGIDTNPVYQRDFCWNQERQTGLIGSLFSGWHIPGLIFNKRVDTILGVQSEVLVCIDGKQRLTSVQHFTQGKIPCIDRYGKKWWFTQGGDSVRGRKYLSQSAKNTFWNKKFLCDIYHGMTDDQEHELFERVQRGNPLTSAEISQAKKGEWQQLVRTFQDDYPLVTALSANKRGAKHDKFSFSFVQIVEARKAVAQGRTGTDKFKGTDTWRKKWFEPSAVDYQPLTAEFKEQLKQIFDRFEMLAMRNSRAFSNDRLNKKAVLAPIEFIAIAYMMDQYGERTNSELERAIRAMRSRVREVNNDNVRRKQAVWNTLLESMRDDLGRNGAGKRPLQENEEEQRSRKIRQRSSMS